MGILNIATQSLSIFRSALTVTSNNIVNASSEGYTRQRVELTARHATRSGSGFVGHGVQIGGYQRLTDEFANLQMRNATSSYEANNAVFKQAVDLDLLLSNDATSVSEAMYEFFGGLENLVDNPAFLPARETLLAQGDVLSDSFKSMYNQLINQSQRVDFEIESKVEEVNSIAKSLADLNVQLLTGKAPQPPDLLDERDKLLKQLSGIIDISTIEQSDGATLVTIGTGQILVSNATTTPLSATRNPFDSSSFLVYVGNSDVTSQLSGGTLGGLINFRTDVLDTIQNRLGRIAINLSDQFNSQHRMGQDLDGNIGDYFFTDINTSSLTLKRASANTGNTGTLVPAVVISNSTSLTDDNYRLDYDGANYTLTNLSTLASTTGAALPLAFEGMTINVSAGAPAAGDSFSIKPTAYGAFDIGLATTRAERIALAQPIRGITNPNNLGNVDLSQGVMNDRATYIANQADLPLSITFTATNAYEIRDGGGALIQAGIPYTATATNNIFPTPAPTNYDPGYRFSMTGNPQVGDTFTIEANAGGINDSRNATEISKIPTNRQVDGNRFSLQEAYGQIISYVGNEANRANVNAQASQILLEQAQARIAETAEVNLEEEASKLLEYQQLFTAASQMLNVVRDIFDILNNTFA